VIVYDRNHTVAAEFPALGVAPDILKLAPGRRIGLVSAKRNDYTPHVPIRFMRKDFVLSLTEAARIRTHNTGGRSHYSEEAASGGEEDLSAVIRRMEQQALVGIT
jgi:hypothetical protein